MLARVFVVVGLRPRAGFPSRKRWTWTTDIQVHGAGGTLQGPLSVVAHNRKVVGALSVVGATESQIFNNFLEIFLKFQQNLWISGNHLQFAEIPGKIRENFNEKQQI